MIRKPQPTEIERVLYWQGQRLLRRDFRDQLAYDGRLRAWHNRSLHESGAVVFGLAVTTSGRNVTAAFGLAYDRTGREIWLADDATVAVPASPDPASYLVVLNPGLSLWPEDCFDTLTGVVLARVTLNDGALTAEDCTSRRIRPIARPHLAQGESVRGNTPWEIWYVDWPDANGDFEAVGVQTRIDTSAAGFTETPHYFASLQAERWSASGQERAEFAPAYFSHVAEPASDGFTFRLLLRDIGRRAFSALSPIARVQNIRWADQIMTLDLDTAADFRKGDPVALVRPRADRASLITGVDDDAITLASSANFPKGLRTALGNLPRYSSILNVDANLLTVLQLAPGAAVEKGTVIGAIKAAGAAKTVARAGPMTESGVVLDRAWADVAAEDHFRMSTKRAVRLSAGPITDPDGAGVTITLPATATVTVQDWIVVVAQGGSLSAPIAVDTVNAQQVHFKGSIAGLTKGSRVFVLDRALAVAAVSTRAGTIQMEVQEPDYFAPGDVVTVAEQPGAIAVVLGVEGGRVSVQAEGGFKPTAGQHHLVAANWKGSSQVLNVLLAQYVQVPRPELFREGDLFLAWTPPASPGQIGPVQPALEQLGRVKTVFPFFGFLSAGAFTFNGAVLLAGEFPAVATVDSADLDGTVHIGQNVFRPGDWVAALGGTAPEFGIAEVSGVVPSGSGFAVTLSRALPDLVANGQIGVVNFRDIAEVSDAPAGSPPGSISLTPALDVRPAGDFLARWSQALPDTPLFYADNSSAAVIDSIAGSRVTLRSFGDGIIPGTVIDGGLLGLASLSPAQPVFRLKSDAVLAVNDAVTVAGAGRFEAPASLATRVAAVDQQNHITFALTSPASDYLLRPERAALLSSFNERFPEAFATFAQKQGLFVSWVACQHEPRNDYPQTDPPVSPCGQS